MWIVSDARDATGRGKIDVAVSLEGWVLCDGRPCLPKAILDEGDATTLEAAEAALVVSAVTFRSAFSVLATAVCPALRARS